ncbi:hypothetical protein SASPL_137977 [Salvia splendens]|uniref:Uncharacterized protein n=1 Tax=Salvia splendens TaxID=180675 RepID=A0A8X8ZDW7_SALSN|nr:hypothetical protein SASPL_137977 [Salvia splendens]
MNMYHRGGHWSQPLTYRDTNAQWRVQEAGVVTTRYRAPLAATSSTTAEAGEVTTPPKPPPPEQTEAEMALVDNDSGIGSLHAHDEKEPTYAIAITPGMRAIVIKSGVYCDIQPVPAGSTSKDYRLKAIPFVFKGDAGVPVETARGINQNMSRISHDIPRPLLPVVED